MQKTRRKILVVDDEASIRLLASSILSEDYIVLKASDGEEAVSMARSQKPDLILMDILMPKVDGYSACHAIKRDVVTGVIPVVMVTALGQELNQKLAERVGADGYIVKPFSVHDLRGKVAPFLGGSQ
jgi:two-component system alkaline phosphatase synthesis response regulator PhoP